MKCCEGLIDFVFFLAKMTLTFVNTQSIVYICRREVERLIQCLETSREGLEDIVLIVE